MNTEGSLCIFISMYGLSPNLANVSSGQSPLCLYYKTKQKKKKKQKKQRKKHWFQGNWGREGKRKLLATVCGCTAGGNGEVSTCLQGGQDEAPKLVLSPQQRDPDLILGLGSLPQKNHSCFLLFKYRGTSVRAASSTFKKNPWLPIQREKRRVAQKGQQIDFFLVWCRHIYVTSCSFKK